MMRHILVEVEAPDIASVYRQLKHIAELVKLGETDGVVNDGIDGSREFHLREIGRED
jgi:hypothetical protein